MKNHKLLGRVVMICVIIFIPTIFINGLMIVTTYWGQYIDNLKETGKLQTEEMRSELLEYEDLSGFINYWLEHSSEMELPGDREDYTGGSWDKRIGGVVR